MVRHGDDGYRIPTPAEDDWERQRNGIARSQATSRALHAEVVAGLWQPQPSHTLLDVKPFKAASPSTAARSSTGDIDVHLTLAEPERARRRRRGAAHAAARRRQSAIFWVVALDDAIDRETVELFRSKEMLSRKERGAQTKDETALVAEEKRRQRRHQDELRRLLRAGAASRAPSTSAATTAAPTPRRPTSASAAGQVLASVAARGLRPLRGGCRARRRRRTSTRC